MSTIWPALNWKQTVSYEVTSFVEEMATNAVPTGHDALSLDTVNYRRPEGYPESILFFRLWSPSSPSAPLMDLNFLHVNDSDEQDSWVFPTVEIHFLFMSSSHTNRRTSSASQLALHGLQRTRWYVSILALPPMVMQEKRLWSNSRSLEKRDG